MIRNVVGGFGNVVIFEIDDGLFAIINVENETVSYNWYWLFLAKYEAVWSADQLEDQKVDKARDIFKKSEIDERLKEELIDDLKGDSKGFMRAKQDALIEKSSRLKKGIYLR